MPKDRDPLESLRKEFGLTAAGLRAMILSFHDEMRRGLAGKPSSLKMLPSYVGQPTGNERGDYIALDLGGTNFRVLEIGLKGRGRIARPEVMKFAISKSLRTGDGKRLFSFLASSVKSFLRSEKEDSARPFDMGFTFSFPVIQDRIDSGKLVVWTKGFRARGVVGRDVVTLLREALVKEGLGNISVTALANDTVGTLAARSYSDRSCDMGVIVGTGTNACYTEDVRAIKRLRRPSKPGERMIVNIEWGNFNRLRRTVYDRSLDRATSNRDRQMLEKMVSGLYLGEIVRYILVDLMKRRILFRGQRTGAIRAIGAIKSEDVSEIVADRSGGLWRTADILRNLGIGKSTAGERGMVREICRIVSVRAGRICAAAIAAVVTKTDPGLSRLHTVAIDGSVYEKHPGFSDIMKNTLEELFGPKARRIRLVLSKDGSGKGAAIIAAVAGSGRQFSSNQVR